MFVFLIEFKFKIMFLPGKSKFPCDEEITFWILSKHKALLICKL